MTGFFHKPTTRGHSRSISLPVRSHPTTIKIEQDINTLILNLQLSSSPLKAHKLALAISGLSDLYKSVQDVLNRSRTQHALTLTNINTDQPSFSSWVDELLEEPLSFLDVCGNLRENITLLRQNMGNLQSTFRRNIGTTTHIMDSVAHYVLSLKAFKREIAKSLKKIDTKMGVSQIMIFDHLDPQLVATVRVLRETGSISSLILREVLGYFSGGANVQPKWSLGMFKLVSINNNKGKGSCDDLNELENLEGSLNHLMVHCKLNKEDSQMVLINQSVCKKLEVLDTRMEALEKELESLFRQLIQTRVYLLNILSEQ